MLTARDDIYLSHSGEPARAVSRISVPSSLRGRLFPLATITQRRLLSWHYGRVCLDALTISILSRTLAESTIVTN